MPRVNFVLRLHLVGALLALVGQPGMVRAVEKTSPQALSVAEGKYPALGYPWENNDLGITDRVPQPWTAIEYAGEQVGVWGRKYSFGGGVLPEQITSQAAPLFVRAPEMRLEVGGRSLLGAGKAHRQWTSRVAQKAGFSVVDEAETCRAEAKVSLEYDGFFQVDVRVEPKRPVNLEQLWVTLPLRDDVAKMFSRYIRYDFVEQRLDRSDFAKSFGRIDHAIRMPFNPAVWIGNHDVGLEWSCETNAGWSPADRESVIRLDPSGDCVTMSIDVISRPVRLTRPFQLSFALYPTPVKPLPDDWRCYAFNNSSVTSPVISPKTHKIYGRAMGGRFPMAYPKLPVVEPSQAKAAWQVVPKGDPAEKIRKGREAMKRAGIRFMPYGALYGMPARMPHDEWKDYADVWKTMNPRGETRGGESGKLLGLKPNEPSTCYICLYPKSFRDFLVWNYVEAIQKYDIDALYLDLASPNFPCQNPNHGHPTSGDGKTEYYPFFWQRRLMQRLYVACKSLKPEFPLMIHHAKVPVVSSGFADFVLSGEALNIFFKQPHWTVKNADSDPTAYVPDYSRLADELYETQYSERKGFVSVMLPEIVKWNETLMKNRPDLLEKYTRILLSRAIPYDVPLDMVRMDRRLLDDVLRAQLEFGGMGGVRFAGPWESQMYLTAKEHRLKIGVYFQPSRRQLLWVVGNWTGQPLTETLAPDFRRFEAEGVKLGGDLQLINAMDHQAIKRKADGTWPVIVGPQDFRIFFLRPGP